MHAQASWTIPTISIVSVVPDKSVTIQTYNFPASDSFDVLMGPIGTKGINGIKVATTASGNGGSFQATYSIPAGLKGFTRSPSACKVPTRGIMPTTGSITKRAALNPAPTPTASAILLWLPNVLDPKRRTGHECHHLGD